MSCFLAVTLASIGSSGLQKAPCFALLFSAVLGLVAREHGQDSRLVNFSKVATTETGVKLPSLSRGRTSWSCQLLCTDG